jgi:hypothetical protein
MDNQVAKCRRIEAKHEDNLTTALVGNVTLNVAKERFLFLEHEITVFLCFSDSIDSLLTTAVAPHKKLTSCQINFLFGTVRI